jgi:hypothetical protein
MFTSITLQCTVAALPFMFSSYSSSAVCQCACPHLPEANDTHVGSQVVPELSMFLRIWLRSSTYNVYILAYTYILKDLWTRAQRDFRGRAAICHCGHHPVRPSIMEPLGQWVLTPWRLRASTFGLASRSVLANPGAGAPHHSHSPGFCATTCSLLQWLWMHAVRRRHATPAGHQCAQPHSQDNMILN